MDNFIFNGALGQKQGRSYFNNMSTKKWLYNHPYLDWLTLYVPDWTTDSTSQFLTPGNVIIIENRMYLGQEVTDNPVYYLDKTIDHGIDNIYNQSTIQQAG